MSDPSVLATPIPELLFAKLSSTPGVQWLEREQITRILGEQQLAAVFSADHPERRIALGQLLKADLVIVVRRRADQTSAGIETVVCETASGLRLAYAESNAAPIDTVSALAPLITGAIAHALDPVTQIVAVPPFVNDDLGHEFDPMKGAFAKLVEAFLASRPGVRVVELAEAEAIGREVALAGAPVTRLTPLFVMGNFRNSGTGDDRRVSIRLRVDVGGHALGSDALERLPPADCGAQLIAAVGTRLDAMNGSQKSRAAPVIAREEASQLQKRASLFKTLGGLSEAIDLLEAALLLEPNDPEINRDLYLALDHRAALRTPRVMRASTKASEIEPAFADFRRELTHWEIYARQSKVVHRPEQIAESGFWWKLDFEIAPLGSTPEMEKRFDAIRTEGQAVARRVLDAKAAAKVDDDSMLVFASYVLARRSWTTLPAAQRAEQYADRVAWGKKFEYVTNAPALFAVLLAPLGGGGDTGSGIWDSLATPERINAIDAFVDSPYERVRTYARRQRERADSAVRSISTRHPVSRPSGQPFVEHPEVTFERVSLTLERQDGRVIPFTHANRTIRSWQTFPGKVDLISGVSSTLWVMLREGRLQQLADSREVAMSEKACYDGRYVWLPMGRVPFGGEGRAMPDPCIKVIDPKTGGSWMIRSAEGLPSFNTSAELAPIEPGQICMAGSFSGGLDKTNRSWCAVLSLDQARGVGACKVFFEARDVPDADPYKTRENIHSAFLADYVHILTRSASTSGGNATRRALIGRQGSINVHFPPLICDLDVPQVLGPMYDPIYRPPQGAAGDLVIQGGLEDSGSFCWLQIDPHSALRKHFTYGVYIATPESTEPLALIHGIPYYGASRPRYLLQPVNDKRMFLIGQQWYYDLDLGAGSVRALRFNLPEAPEFAEQDNFTSYQKVLHLGRSAFYGPIIYWNADTVYRIQMQGVP